MSRSSRAAMVGAALAALLAAHSPTAFGQDDVASDFFRAGATAYARGDFVGAARAFEQAHDRAPRGTTILNAARAWEAAREPARAADAYEAALRQGGLSSRDAEVASTRLAALQPSLGVLEVTSPAGAIVAVAHVEKAPVPTRVHASPGQHEVRITRADGRRESRRVTATAGEVSRVVFEPDPPPSAPKARRAAPSPSRPVVDSAGDSRVTRRVLGGVSLGTAAAMSGAAIALGVASLDARDEYHDGGSVDLDAYDRAVAMRTWTNVAWGGALTFAIVGAVLVVTSLDGEPPRAGALQPVARF